MDKQGIPISVLFDQVNQWLNALTPIMGVFIGATISLIVLKSLHKAINLALGHPPENPFDARERDEELRRMREGGILRQLFNAEQLARIDAAIERYDAQAERDGEPNHHGFSALAAAFEDVPAKAKLPDGQYVVNEAGEVEELIPPEPREKRKRKNEELLDEKPKNDFKRKNDEYLCTDDGTLFHIIDDPDAEVHRNE